MVKLKNEQIRDQTVGLYVNPTNGDFYAAPDHGPDVDPGTVAWNEQVSASSLGELVKRVTVKLRVRAKVLHEPYATFNNGKLERGVIRGLGQKYPNDYLVTRDGKKEKLSHNALFVRPDMTLEQETRLKAAFLAHQDARREYDAAFKDVKVECYTLKRDIEAKLNADDEPEAAGKVVPIR